MPDKATPRKNPVLNWEFARMYPFYVQKAESKGRTQAEVDQIIQWLFGYDAQQLQQILNDGTTFETFLTKGPKPNKDRQLITGVVCGVRVENITDPTAREMRYLDKLIDELAKGKKMDTIFRTPL